MSVRTFFAIAAAMLAVWAGVPTAASANTLYVHASGNNEPCPTTTYTTISGAVAAASAGDQIIVCEGDYLEQVTLNKDLTLLAYSYPGNNNKTVIESPAIHFSAAANASAIVVITNGAHVTLDGFDIMGPGQGGCGSIQAGIRVEGAAVATLTHNHITDIHDTPLSACQTGIGIVVGRGNDNGPSSGTATISYNTITDFQKGGILIDNAGSFATITNNVITGKGKTDVIAQNGVQVSRGATVPPSMISQNTISGNFYQNTPDYGNHTAGIVYAIGAYDQSYEGPLNSGNTLRHNRPNVLIIP